MKNTEKIPTEIADAADINYMMCPVEYTMNRIAGKWKLVILWHLYSNNIMRYGEIKKSLSKITHKMLSNQLKELMADDIVHKKLYNQVPPKTEYSLTEKGKTLVPILNMLHSWGTENRTDL